MREAEAQQQADQGAVDTLKAEGGELNRQLREHWHAAEPERLEDAERIESVLADPEYQQLERERAEQVRAEAQNSRGVQAEPAPDPVQPLAETAAVTDDALDAALAAAVSKAQQHQVEQDIPQPQRPVIESTEIDLERDPLAQPASPLPVQRGAVLMNATSGEPYRAPSADQLAEWQRELDSRPEPTDDELVDLVPEGLAEALELLDEQQDEDGIDLDEFNHEPGGPSFG